MDAPATPAPAPTTCFYGSFERAVDAKGRFNLPFRLRRTGAEAGADAYVALKGPDGQVVLAPDVVFEAAFRRLQEGEPSRDKRSLVRRISAGSHRLEPDGQGRVAVPSELLAEAGITRRVLCIGVGQGVELWDPERFAVIDAALGSTDGGSVDRFFVY